MATKEEAAGPKVSVLFVCLGNICKPRSGKPPSGTLLA